MDAAAQFNVPNPPIALFRDEEFRMSVNSVQEYAIFMIDPEGVIITWNDGAKLIKGYNADEIIGKHVSIFYTKEDNEKGLFAKNLRVATERGSFEDEGLRVRKDGVMFPAGVIFTACYNEQHELAGFAIVTRDISAQKIIKRDLSRQPWKQAGLYQSPYEKLLFHVENTPVGFIEWDDKLHIKSISKKAEEIFGWNLQEFTESKKSGYSQVYEQDQALAIEAAEQLLSGKMERNNIQHRNYTKDGKVIWCDWFNLALKDEEGKVITIMSMVQNIAERKLAEENLKHSEERYLQIVETAQEGIWLMDKNNLTSFVNKKMCEILGYLEEEMLGKDFFYFIVDADKQKASKFLGRRKAGKVENINFCFLMKSGKCIWTNISVTPILDDDGNYKSALAMVEDITEKKILQQQLLEEQMTKQKEIAKAVVNAKEKERTQIGEELHDNVNQLLAVSKFYLNHSLLEPDCKPFILKSQEYIANAMEEIRKLSHALIGPDHDKTLGLIDSIEELISNISIVNEASITFKHSTFNEEECEVGLKLVIYRIIQEQLGNILKHAEASKVKIELKKENDVTLIINDNGKGFDIFAKRTGTGLVNIRSRAALHDGKVQILSSPGNGCKMTIIFKKQC